LCYHWPYLNRTSFEPKESNFNCISRLSIQNFLISRSERRRQVNMGFAAMCWAEMQSEVMIVMLAKTIKICVRCSTWEYLVGNLALVVRRNRLLPKSSWKLCILQSRTRNKYESFRHAKSVFSSERYLTASVRSIPFLLPYLKTGKSEATSNFCQYLLRHS
jgi:hypothetical protein